jgi:hypothetical protein
MYLIQISDLQYLPSGKLKSYGDPDKKKTSTKELSGNKTTQPRHLKIAPACIIIVHHHHISMKSENIPKHCHTNHHTKSSC